MKALFRASVINTSYTDTFKYIAPCLFSFYRGEKKRKKWLYRDAMTLASLVYYFQVKRNEASKCRGEGY